MSGLGYNGCELSKAGKNSQNQVRQIRIKRKPDDVPRAS
jgi:hypothetical protein